LNKHDFYKEILSQYTFDEEKIRRNAKRASSASFFTRNSKWLPLATAAAVFLIVFVGHTMTDIGRGSIIDNDAHGETRSGNFIPMSSTTEPVEPVSPPQTDTPPVPEPPVEVIAPTVAQPTDNPPQQQPPVVIGEPVIDDTPDDGNDGIDTVDADDPEDSPAENPDDHDTDPPLPPDDEIIEPDQPQTTLEITVDNGISADFINQNGLIILTRNQVLLYEITTADGADTHEIAQSFDTHNPKITFSDMDTGTLLIIGSDAFGRQTDLFIADGTNSELRRLDTSNVTQGLTDISYAVYNNGEIILMAQSAETYAIYVAQREGSGWFFDKVAESTDSLIVLGCTDDGFIYAQEADDSETKIFMYNTAGFSAEEIDIGIPVEPGFRFERSPDARNFAVITDDGAYIWIEGLYLLTDYSVNAADVKFHRYSGNIFNDGMGKWYTIHGTQIVSTTESEADALTKKPEFSSAYRLSDITPALVRIEIVF